MTSIVPEPGSLDTGDLTHLVGTVLAQHATTDAGPTTPQGCGPSPTPWRGC